MKRFIFILFAALLYAGAANAADDISTSTHGDKCTANNVTDYTNPIRGNYLVTCNRLCETIDNDDTCTEYDFQAAGSEGIPDKVFVEVHTNTTCDAGWTVDINQHSVTGPVAGTNEHDVVTLNATTTSAMIGIDLPILRFWKTTFGTNTNCVDITLLLHSYYRQ